MSPATRRGAVPDQVATGLGTVAELGRQLRSGRNSSRRIVETCLATADRIDPVLGVYLARFDETAIAAADQADAELAAGVDRGPLHGIPVGIKDVVPTAEAGTTAQSTVLPDRWNVPHDAPVVERLRQGGAIVLGKTTTMECMIGMPRSDGPFPVPVNPWDTARWPGGTSSGSASGVAARLFPLGIGTDTGGSVRVPAALCGVTGFKPTFGAIPIAGCVPLAYSVDHVGILATTAEDCAMALEVIGTGNAYRSGEARLPQVDERPLTGLRVGIDRDHHIVESTDRGMLIAFDESVEQLARLGASLVSVSLPLYQETRLAAQAIVVSEALDFHLPMLRSRWHEYAPDTRSFLASGAYISGADYNRAQRIRRAASAQLATVFQGVDVIATPTTNAPAPTLEAIELDAASALTDLMHTPYWNAVGYPAVALPMGAAASLPVSLHLAARPHADRALLTVGRIFQAATDWHTLAPTGLTI